MPFPDDDEPMSGPWEGRVRYLESGEAVTPGRLIVPNDAVDPAREMLSGLADFQPVDDESKRIGAKQHTLLLADDDTDLDTAIGMLNTAQIPGQPSHVLFATNHGQWADEGVSVQYGLECDGNAHPAGSQPGHAIASPVYANPVYANPVYANRYRSTGERESTARPSAHAMPTWRDVVVHNPERTVNVVILDTGMADATYQPPLFQGMAGATVGADAPDENSDQELDPAAGHGTFIAGLIRRLAPTASLKSVRVLSTFGDGDESLIAYQIDQLADGEDRVDLLNLSFGGYSASTMEPLTAAINNLLHAKKGSVVVASAGNDATCRPMWPASLGQDLDDVIAVGALDADGNPTEFTNFGPWVRAWSHGPDVVSAFFTSAPGTTIADWATWSGTSFAAPIVTGMIARTMLEQDIDAHAAWAALEAGAAPTIGYLGARIELPPQV
jgi:subtilisin family serine protease